MAAAGREAMVTRGVDTGDMHVFRHMVNRELGRIRDDPRGLVPGTVTLAHEAPGRRWIVRYGVEDDDAETD